MAPLSRYVYGESYVHWQHIQMFLSAVGIVVGCLSFVVLKFQYNNQYDANWALMSGIMAALGLIMGKHIMDWNSNVNPENSPSVVDKFFICLGLFFIAAIMCAVILATSWLFISNIY